MFNARFFMKNFIFFFFLLLATLAQSQSIYGKISDELGNPVQANVLLLQGDEIVSFTFSDTDGDYSIEIPSSAKLDTLVLEIKKYGYKNIHQPITIQQNKKLHFDFILEKPIIELAPIKIIGQQRAIRERKDTVVYNAESFKDGSERKVEDLLKNLPGIEVADSGKIKYKGKEISKLLIEGDDLFDDNYVTGSRNINVDVVDKIEAIDKFSENYLLKGLEDSKKVALNIKLKKGMADWSGDINLGYGIENRFDLGGNLIGIEKKNKNFSTISYNNIGANRSPKDYFGNIKSKDESEISEYVFEKLIPETAFSNGLGRDRTNLNQMFFGNFNHIYKYSDKLSTRWNINYIQDKLSLMEEKNIQYFLPTGNLRVENLIQTDKKPRYYDANGQVIWKVSPHSMLEYNLKWYDESINTDFAINSTQNQNIESDLSSNAYFLLNKLDYTHKLNQNLALSINVNHAQNSSPQQLIISPSFDFSTGNYLVQQNAIQQNQQRLNVTNIYANLFGKRENNEKFGATIHFSDRQMHYNTALKLSDKINFDNEINWRLNKISANGFYNIKWGEFSINPKVEIAHYYNHIADVDSAFSVFVVNPELNLIYQISPQNQIILRSEWNQKPQTENKLYPNLVMTSYRTLNRNKVQWDFKKSFSANLGYFQNDMYNYLKFSVFAGYFRNKNTYLHRNQIHENYVIYDAIMNPKEIDTYSLNVGFEKFFPILSSTIKLNSNYNHSYTYNFINYSALRKNKTQVFGNEFFFKTAFDIPINFQNVLNHQFIQYQAMGGDLNLKMNSISNELKVYVKPNKLWFSEITIEYQNPEINKKNAYLFIDAAISYKPENKKWLARLDAKNLLGNQHFSSASVSDYYRLENQRAINSRYVILSLNYQF